MALMVSYNFTEQPVGMNVSLDLDTRYKGQNMQHRKQGI